MNKIQFLVSIALMFFIMTSKAQTPMQFAGVDCNGNSVDLFADLDAGKAVIIHFYMPNCGSCPPPAQKIQKMANRINAKYPGMVKGYAFPFQNSTTCTYSADWVSSNSLGTLYQPMDSGAAQVAHYGGFGMPTVVLIGGKGANKRVMFSSLSFSTKDTTEMRDSILSLMGEMLAVNNEPVSLTNFLVYPSPASETVNIVLNLKEVSSITVDITDLSGRVVRNVTSISGITSINTNIGVSDLPKGCYLIRANLNGVLVTRNIVITH